MAKDKDYIDEPDMSANAPLPAQWRKQVEAQNAAVRNAIAVPAKPPKSVTASQESARKSLTIVPGKKRGGLIRGCGVESRGKTKGKFR